VKVVLDHHFPLRIAVLLRDLGHDVQAAQELGWQDLDDDALLTLCMGEGYALMTNNVSDCAVLARHWQAEGRAHAGLVFTSDASRPRTREAVGRFVADVAALMAEHPSDAGLLGRVMWL
jgi:hypothetical protein